jgi:hypothetical protein
MQETAKEIMRRFEESWEATVKEIDRLILEHNFERFKPLMSFLTDIKAKGLSNAFRFGRAMDGLYITRSVEHRLRTDQKFIRIEVNDNSFDIVFRDGERVFRELRITDLNDYRLNNLLKTLKESLPD